MADDSDARVLHPFMGMDAASLIEARARQRGNHPLLTFAPFEGPSQIWSYTRFADEVSRLAGGLHARGIRPGDRVLIHLENCPETLLARFACAWLGAVAVLSNAQLAGPELTHVAAPLGVRAAITQPKLAARVAEHCGGLEWMAVTATDAGETPSAETSPAKSESFAALLGEKLARRAPDPTAPAVILFTTGSTARPKAVLWTHANILWGGKVGAMQQALRADDVYQVHLPLFHVVGFTWSVVPAIWAGASVVLQPRFSTSRFWPAALAHRSTVSSHAGTDHLLREIPVPEHRFRQWLFARHDPARDAYFGLRGACGWGMTEMIIPAIAGDLASEQRVHSIGRPFPGYDVRVETEGGGMAAPGEPGHLLVKGVRGLAIFQDYVDNPQAMAEAFDASGFFRTGDRVILHPDGWLEYVDRIKDVIKVGGESVSAAEVEAAVLVVRGVRDAAVVSRPDPIYGEVPVAFVVLADDGLPSADAVVATIVDQCRKSLAKFKLPRQVIVIPDLPRIGNNKIHRTALRDLAKSSAPVPKAS